MSCITCIYCRRYSSIHSRGREKYYRQYYINNYAFRVLSFSLRHDSKRYIVPPTTTKVNVVWSLRDMRYAIWQTRFVICHLRYEVCHMRYAKRGLWYAICDMRYAICDMPNAVSDTPFAICDMPYAGYVQSIVVDVLSPIGTLVCSGECACIMLYLLYMHTIVFCTTYHHTIWQQFRHAFFAEFLIDIVPIHDASYHFKFDNLASTQCWQLRWQNSNDVVFPTLVVCGCFCWQSAKVKRTGDGCRATGISGAWWRSDIELGAIVHLVTWPRTGLR